MRIYYFYPLNFCVRSGKGRFYFPFFGRVRYSAGGIMTRTPLQFPVYDFSTRWDEGVEKIFDMARRKYVVLTPEEWVRQHVVRFLSQEKMVPVSLMALEKNLKHGGMIRRADVVVYQVSATPALIVECKAPLVKITQETFEQIARYNVAMRVKYLMVTNGLNHYYCVMDYGKWSYAFIKELPPYEDW